MVKKAPKYTFGRAFQNISNLEHPQKGKKR